MKGSDDFLSVHFLKLAYIDVCVKIYMKKKTMDYVYIALYNLGRVSMLLLLLLSRFSRVRLCATP